MGYLIYEFEECTLGVNYFCSDSVYFMLFTFNTRTFKLLNGFFIFTLTFFLIVKLEKIHFEHKDFRFKSAY